MDNSTDYAFPDGNIRKGMKIRQWYKGQVLAGEQASMMFDSTEIANLCGDIADAMIKEDEEHERKRS